MRIIRLAMNNDISVVAAREGIEALWNEQVAELRGKVEQRRYARSPIDAVLALLDEPEKAMQRFMAQTCAGVPLEFLRFKTIYRDEPETSPKNWHICERLNKSRKVKDKELKAFFAGVEHAVKIINEAPG